MWVVMMKNNEGMGYGIRRRRRRGRAGKGGREGSK